MLMTRVMMYNKNICLTTFQVKSHILILIQEFKGFKEVYTGSDPSYRSRRGALQPSLPLGQDLKPSAMTLGKSSRSRGTAGTRSCNKAKGICRAVQDQRLCSSLIQGPPVPPPAKACHGVTWCPCSLMLHTAQPDRVSNEANLILLA